MCGVELALLGAWAALGGVTFARWRGLLVEGEAAPDIRSDVTRDDVTKSSPSRETSHPRIVTPRASRRGPAMTGAERMRLCRARKAAALAAARPGVVSEGPRPAPASVGRDDVTKTPVASSPSPSLAREGEERLSLSPPEYASARDPRHTRRERLMDLAMEEARRRLSPADHARLLEQITENGRYERYLARGTSAFPAPVRDFFEKLFPLVQAPKAEAHPGSQQGSHQSEMLLPIKGGRAPPRAREGNWAGVRWWPPAAGEREAG